MPDDNPQSEAPTNDQNPPAPTLSTAPTVNNLNDQGIVPNQPSASPAQTGQPIASTPVLQHYSQSQPPQLPPATSKKFKIVVSLVIGLVVVIIVLFIVLRLLFADYIENGSSMAPTINSGQLVILMKGQSQPKIGDIIVFTESGLSKYGQPTNTSQLIERVVGLPGDRIKITNDELTVYNSAHPNGYDPDDFDGLSHVITAGNINAVVPRGDVYVLGDNRTDSLDSRIFGPVPISSIIGREIHVFNHSK